MNYKVNFPSGSIEKKFEKKLKKIPPGTQNKIINKVKSLSENPRPFGRKPFKKLKPPLSLYKYTAQYRIRIGDYRVLYDVDDTKKIVWILALRKRGKKTYK